MAMNLTATANEGDFNDGTFEALAAVQRQIAITEFPEIEDDTATTWLATIRDPSSLLSTLWDTLGEVHIVRANLYKIYDQSPWPIVHLLSPL